MIDTRDELHQIVNFIPQERIAEVRRAMLAELAKTDPALAAALNAPIDDEPETPEEAAAVAEAWEDVRAGRVHRLEDIRKELLEE